MSLRWLRALLDADVEVHGQIVVCPDVNNGEILKDTMLGVLDYYPELASLAVVPLGISDHSNEPTMRPHSASEAAEVVTMVEQWQQIYLEVLGRRLVYAADEYYLLAELPFPAATTYEGFAMHEDGIGMARTFEQEFFGLSNDPVTPAAGFFSWVDGAPAEGYRAARLASEQCGFDGDQAVSNQAVSGQAVSDGGGAGTVQSVMLRPSRTRPVGIITSAYGAEVIEPLIRTLDRDDVRMVVVDNQFFGGNIGVAGLMVGQDISRALEGEPEGHRYLLPDVCLSQGRFLDDQSLDDLPRTVEVISTDGLSLRSALAAGSHQERSRNE